MTKSTNLEVEIHKLIARTVVIGSVLLSFPFNWQAETQSFIPLSFIKFRFFQGLFFFDLFNRGIRSITFAWYVYNKQLSFNQMVFGGILFMSFVINLWEKFNIFSNRDQLLKWMNAMMGLGKRLEGNLWFRIVKALAPLKWILHRILEFVWENSWICWIMSFCLRRPFYF